MKKKTFLESTWFNVLLFLVVLILIIISVYFACSALAHIAKNNYNINLTDYTTPFPFLALVVIVLGLGLLIKTAKILIIIPRKNIKI